MLSFTKEKCISEKYKLKKLKNCNGLQVKVDTCIMSALPFATPDATVPIPASATSFTDTFAFGFTCSTIDVS